MALSPVPVLFRYRAFTSMSIPLAELAGIYLAIVIVSSRDWLLDRFNFPQRRSPVVGMRRSCSFLNDYRLKPVG